MEFYKLQAAGNDFILLDRRPKTLFKTEDRRPETKERKAKSEKRKAKSAGHPASGWVGEPRTDLRPKAEGRRYNYSGLAKRWCGRKTGIGADGLLVIEPSERADFRMRVFNADGSEAEMCGNGLRCAALYYIGGQRAEDVIRLRPSTSSGLRSGQVKMSVETKAGIKEVFVVCRSSLIAKKIYRATIRIKMGDISGLKLGIPLRVLGQKIKVDCVDTGVPHTVVFVRGLDKIDVLGIGRAIRFHRRFSSPGTNVDFAEVVGDNKIRIRTYERGVEQETLACGTGAAAAAVIFCVRPKTEDQRAKSEKRGAPSQWLGRRTENRFKTEDRRTEIEVETRGGEILRVYLGGDGETIDDLWLEGCAEIVYKGERSL